MSSPVDPSLAGCISSAFSTAENSKINFRSFILFIFIANAPDLDFLPGIITGQPNLYHHGISHSIGIGIVVSLILALVLNHKKSLAIAKNFWLYFSLYISHLFLDYLSVDGRPPAGIPVFWPISGEYFIFPFPILPPILHSQFDDASTGEVLADVFSLHNLYVVSLEFMVLLAAVVNVFAMKGKFLRSG